MESIGGGLDDRVIQTLVFVSLLCAGLCVWIGPGNVKGRKHSLCPPALTPKTTGGFGEGVLFLLP
jgi:hypothetical protein